MSVKQSQRRKKKGAENMKNQEIDEWSGCAPQPFVQLDSTVAGYTEDTPAAVKKRCEAALKRAYAINAKKASKKKAKK